jgi:[ribosomal protein S5]-alanine N-acetyltransferase
MQSICTERLRIRKFRSGDLEPFVKFMIDPESTGFLAFTHEQKNREGAKLLLESTIESYASDQPMLAFAVEEQCSQKFVGFCGLNPQDKETIEIMYAVIPAARHQGYATEMLMGITDHAFDELGYDRVIAFILPKHAASKRVVLRAKFIDCGLVRNDNFREAVHQFVLKKDVFYTRRVWDMDLETNKRLVRRQFEELINNKNLMVIDSDMAVDFIDHEAAPGIVPGLEGVRQHINGLHQNCPDLHVTIEDIIAESDRVVVRNTWRGTHTGHLFGIPPTGKCFVLKGIVVWRIRDGRICERWATLDQLGLHQQLGAV